MTVVWGDDARAYVREQMARMRPLEALRWLGRLEGAAARLELFPWSGHPVPEVPRLSARQTFVLPYRLIYFIGDEEVTITTVCHTRESLTKHPEPHAVAANDG